jgi:hypothetical protein
MQVVRQRQAEAEASRQVGRGIQVAVSHRQTEGQAGEAYRKAGPEAGRGRDAYRRMEAETGRQTEGSG